MRLQKFLSAAGVCSRRRAEKHILAGGVFVNGVPARELGVKVDPENDQVTFRGKPVKIVGKNVYIALHKPKGYVTSCNHPGRKIVLDLIDLSFRIYPIGRLDKDSTGLLLLTNDGGLHHRLLHPSFDHEKMYEVRVAGPISGETLNTLAGGVRLRGKMTRPAQIKRISGTSFRMTLKEGRNRQIRRMVQKTGHRVVALKRVQFADIALGNLKSGRWRYLTGKEIKELKKIHRG